MNRWIAFALCAILGLVMLLCGLQVPAHLRAVDARVIQKAGRITPGLVTHGLALVRDKKLGAAQLISQAAEAEAERGPRIGVPENDCDGERAEIRHPRVKPRTELDSPDRARKDEEENRDGQRRRDLRSRAPAPEQQLHE